MSLFYFILIFPSEVSPFCFAFLSNLRRCYHHLIKFKSYHVVAVSNVQNTFQVYNYGDKLLQFGHCLNCDFSIIFLNSSTMSLKVNLRYLLASQMKMWNIVFSTSNSLSKFIATEDVRRPVELIALAIDFGQLIYCPYVSALVRPMNLMSLNILESFSFLLYLFCIKNLTSENTYQV